VGEPTQAYRAVAQNHIGPVVFRYFDSPVSRVYNLKKAIPKTFLTRKSSGGHQAKKEERRGEKI
jgi:hypothetical protein